MQFATQHLALELRIFAHITADHALDLSRLQKQSKAEVVHPCIVTDAGESFGTGLHQSSNALLRDTTKAEATDHQGHTVLDAHKGSIRVRNEFVHLVKEGRRR